MTDSYVTALLHERASCLAAKKADRVRAIDDVLLSRFGIAVETEAEVPVVEVAVELQPETAEARRPRGRPPRDVN